MKEKEYSELSAKEKSLVEQAERAMANSYSPYSNYRVGAAILTQNGEIILGTNYESASYGLTLCAERSAISAANTEGLNDFALMAIIGSGEEACVPCGACRQIIHEAAQRSANEIELIMANQDKSKIKTAKISELLPEAFSL